MFETHTEYPRGHLQRFDCISLMAFTSIHLKKTRFWAKKHLKLKKKEFLGKHFGNQENISIAESIGSPVFSFSKYFLCITTSKKCLQCFIWSSFLCAIFANRCSKHYICNLSFKQTFLAICHSRQPNNSYSKLSCQIAILMLVPHTILAKEF